MTYQDALNEYREAVAKFRRAKIEFGLCSWITCNRNCEVGTLCEHLE